MGYASDLELHLPLDDHDDLVRVVDEVRPDLAWPGGSIQRPHEKPRSRQSAATAFRSTGVVMTRIITKPPRSWQRCVTSPPVQPRSAYRARSEASEATPKTHRRQTAQAVSQGVDQPAPACGIAAAGAPSRAE